MSKPKTLTGALYFSDHEPHVVGHLTIGDVHYELAGVRRSVTRTDFTGRRQCGCEELQGDFFDEPTQHDD
jgi:hypothetical protein